MLFACDKCWNIRKSFVIVDRVVGFGVRQCFLCGFTCVFGVPRVFRGAQCAFVLGVHEFQFRVDALVIAWFQNCKIQGSHWLYMCGP